MRRKIVISSIIVLLLIALLMIINLIYIISLYVSKENKNYNPSLFAYYDDVAWVKHTENSGFLFGSSTVK